MAFQVGQEPRSGDARYASMSTGELVGELIGQAQRLFREEVRLARAETRDEIKQATRGGAMLGAGAVLGFTAVLVLAFCVVYAIANALPLWLSALIVGVVLAIAAGVLAMVGKERVKFENRRPDETLQSLREDREWARETMQSARSRRHATV